MLPIRRYLAALPLTAVCFLARVAPLGAQARTTVVDYATGGEYEDYLRALQTAGMIGLYPWSIRAFSPREIERFAAQDTAGPWRQSSALDHGAFVAGPLVARATFNSAFPYGANDGPVWAGRGLTTSITAGFAAARGPFSLTVAPLAFRAENRPFPLLYKGTAGPPSFFQDGLSSGLVDHPQRFGDRPYSMLDPGNSALRFDSRAVTFGVSTANEWIGPATEFPFLLGNNAPGFPHIFIGTGEPVQLWIATVHARVAWGKLYQSSYSPVVGSTRFISAAIPGTVRLATYAEFVMVPRGVPGLEAGFGRFIHVPYRAGEPAGDFWRKPFKVFFLKNEYAAGDTSGADNQLASAFFRWVFPHSGFELFGERGYEDQFYDRRDFLERPDHEREYMLGFQKTVRRAGSLDVIKAELTNYEYPSGSIYLHQQLRQGHTNRGQLLGISAAAQSAAASTLSWTRYAESGRTTVTLRRVIRGQDGEYLAQNDFDPRVEDVIVAAGLERMRLGRRMDIGAKVEAMQDFNRNFASDVPNLNLQLTMRLKRW